MRLLTALSLASSSLLGAVSATSSRAANYNKRDLMSCEQTYGGGWAKCGPSDSMFCYNPTLGQTCCPDDAGFCDAGSYCAPVAGYCCHNGEDLVTCGKNAGFSLPASLISSVSAAAAVPSTVSFAVVAATTVLPTTASTAPGPIAAATPTPATTSRANSTSGATFTTPVQVSVAQREHSTLMLMSMAICVVGLFMASC